MHSEDGITHGEQKIQVQYVRLESAVISLLVSLNVHQPLIELCQTSSVLL